MVILNLGGDSENSPARAPRKKLRVILGIGALAAVTGIGSTLAANISLNGGGNVEFGQGVATTAACDDSITLTPISEFSNTEEEAAFAMTAIEVSGIDLTPEGWDMVADDWATGYVPAHAADPADGSVMVEAAWSDPIKEHSGQYISGLDGNDDPIWTNTCANKSLMIHAYTDNPEYAYATSRDDITTPLRFNGANFHRPDIRYSEEFGLNRGYNLGIGFRVETYDYYLNGSRDDYNNWVILDNDEVFSDGANFNPITDNLNRVGTDDTWNNSTYTIYLKYGLEFPPLESKMVDKLTIESAAVTPDGWDSDPR